MNSRAFCLLELHGTKFQFGGTPDLGCQDSLFTLKTLINAHKNQHLPLFVAFVNLVNAYDTANHDLILCIFEKYGAPPSSLQPSTPCIPTSLWFSKLRKRFEKSCKMLTFAKATTWPQFSSCS
jgi:hypothetical protein